MANRIVTVNDQLRLPIEVEDALRAHLDVEFSESVQDAQQAAADAVDAAAVAEAAAASVTLPTDDQVAGLVANETSETRVQLDAVIEAAGGADVVDGIQTPGSDIDVALKGIYALKPNNGERAVGQFEQFVSVGDFDPQALGGARADRLAIVDALNEGISRGLPVLFPRATYVIWSSIQIPSGTVIIGNGATIDFSNFGGSAAFELTGGTGVSGTITGGASRGSTSISVNTASNFTVGDWVRLRSEALLNTDTSQRKGEFVRIASISSQQFTPEQPLQDIYATGSSAGWDLFDFAHDVHIEGLTFYGGSTTGYGIRARRARDFQITGCTFKHCNYAGIRLEDVVNVRVSDCHFEDAEDTSLCYGLGGFYACQNVVMTNCTASNVRHMVALGGGGANYGAPRHMEFSNCIASGVTNAGFDTHSGVQDITFSNCTVAGGYEGFYTEGTRISFVNCSVSQVQRYGYAMINRTTDAMEFNFTGNRATRVGSHGIRIVKQASGAMSGGVISGNQLSTIGGSGIFISSDVDSMRNIAVTNNSVVNSGGTAVVVQNVAFASVTGNTLTSDGSRAIQIDASPRATVSGNSFRCLNGTGILITNNSDSVTVTGNLGEDLTTGVAGSADSDTVLVVGNNFDGASISVAGSGGLTANNL